VKYIFSVPNGKLIIACAPDKKDSITIKGAPICNCGRPLQELTIRKLGGGLQLSCTCGYRRARGPED
jgi:hypothetical protein